MSVHPLQRQLILPPARLATRQLPGNPQITENSPSQTATQERRLLARFLTQTGPMITGNSESREGTGQRDSQGYGSG